MMLATHEDANMGMYDIKQWCLTFGVRLTPRTRRASRFKVRVNDSTITMTIPRIIIAT